MFQLSPVILASVLTLLVCPSAQQFPPPATYDTVLKSPINPNITISYKEPRPGTCATAFSTQKQYSGYVTLPPFTLQPYQQNYSINTFFWFFEARNNSNTAPLTIWLNGGPGSSSMVGLFREAGPCEVIQLPDGSYGTQPNVWGWDRSSNMLFIDQPTQVGFSYDETVNATSDLRDGNIVYSPMPLPPNVPAWSFLNGTFPSGSERQTENSTVVAASAAWHFLQGFLSAFPQYNPGQHPNMTTTEPTGVNLFAESYGGQYGPTFADYFEDQNERRRTGEISANDTLEIKLASLGIINGMVDTLIQIPSITSFVFNNTYGLQTIDQTAHLNLLSDFRSRKGCKEWVNQCRERMKNDPEGESFDSTSSSICASASNACYGLMGAAIAQSGRDPYDVRVTPPSSFPNHAYLEYLNSADVQQSIGAKVNYTESNMVVYEAFGQTGDVIRGSQIRKLAELLARGIRVAFMYGDADIICNWIGGEAVSLELARLSSYNTTFPSAGYADIVANASYVGGQVRQYGNLSFSRIYDAGHTIPSYQPETAFVVFSRIIRGDDIGMGHNVDLSDFATRGPPQSARRNKVPAQPKATCWARAISATCNDQEKAAISKGLGVVRNGMWLAQDVDPIRSSRDHAGTAGSHTGKPFPTIAVDLTGVYTATATPRPTSTSSASQLRVPFSLPGVSHLRAVQKLFARDEPDTVDGRASPSLVSHVDDHPDRVTDDSSDSDSDDEDRGKPKKRNRTALIAGLAGGLGGGLLLLLLLLLCCLCMRRRRSRRPETPSPLASQESVLPPVVKMAESEPRKPSLVRRLTMRNITAPPGVPHDVERPPALDHQPTARRASIPMEPIPEVYTPRPSGDVHQSTMAPSEHTPLPVVQRNAAPTPSADPGTSATVVQHNAAPTPSADPGTSATVVQHNAAPTPSADPGTSATVVQHNAAPTPIVEHASVEKPETMVQRNAAPNPSTDHMSVEKSEPVVERNAAPTRPATDPLYLAEEPIKTTQPTEKSAPVVERNAAPTRQPTENPAPVVERNAAPTRRPTDPLYLAEEPIKTGQPTESRQHAERGPHTTTRNAESEQHVVGGKHSETVHSNQTGHSHQTGQHDADPTSASRVSDSELDAHRHAETHRDHDAVERQHTPPGRTTTLPPQERSSAAKFTSEAIGQPADDEKGQVVTKTVHYHS